MGGLGPQFGHYRQFGYEIQMPHQGQLLHCALDERLRPNAGYIWQLPPLLDLKIMLWTVGSIVKRSGA